jgi:hypothetical protein
MNTIKKAKIWKLQVFYRNPCGSSAQPTSKDNKWPLKEEWWWWGKMTRSIALTIEKRRLEFEGVRNKGNTDLLTFKPHNDLSRIPPLKYPKVN